VPDQVTVRPGQTFSVDLMIDITGEAVISYGTAVLFEPQKVSMKEVRPGSDPILGRPSLVYNESQGDQQLGVLYIMAAQNEDRTRPVGFRVHVAEIVFAAVEPGSATLEIANSDLLSAVGPYKRITGQGVCRVTIQPPPPSN
jgi:hypothetical protein